MRRDDKISLFQLEIKANFLSYLTYGIPSFILKSDIEELTITGKTNNILPENVGLILIIKTSTKFYYSMVRELDISYMKYPNVSTIRTKNEKTEIVEVNDKFISLLYEGNLGFIQKESGFYDILLQQYNLKMIE